VSAPAIHIGHSTGGGEVARYVARHQERVSKAVLVASLTPNMYRSEDNPSGQPPEWFEAIRAGVLGNRSEFYRFVPENPFYGYNVDGAKPSEAIIANWWRQGMAGGALAHYATVASWLEDYTEDLKKITVPVLVMHGEADQSRPVRKFRAACGQLAQERVAEDLSRLPPWHANHTCGCPQPRLALVHKVLTTSLIHHLSW